MFCYQCEQTAKGTGCTVAGVCGKDSRTAALQDLLVHQAKRIGTCAHRARQLGVKDQATDRFIPEALFSTVTNVNFDPERLAALLRESASVLAQIKSLYETACRQGGKKPEILPPSPADVLSDNLEGLIRQGESVALPNRRAALGDDVAGLQELLTQGLKGTAAYAHHARILGREDEAIYAFFHEALAYLAQPSPTLQELLGLCLKCGEINLKTLALLDSAHTTAFGHPVPTKVRIHPLKGKAILVSGHDLLDLEAILKQTEGKDILVYTHGEMLPAHGYPGLHKYPHLAGNYGGAWQDQKKEFAGFPGAILMTTNCIQKPQDSYLERIFTCGLVAWPGVRHISDRQFGPVIEASLKAEGFQEDGPGDTILVGFGHAAVMNVADKVVAAVKAGAIRRFFLIGGCDGAKSGRNYYTDFARQVPADCVILTLACGKYRFNKIDFGAICFQPAEAAAGSEACIPRLLDCGQCNDAYSAIQIAVALAKAFNVGVNDLPLSMVLSWYEQKAVCILLTLLFLGIRNIRLGPSLPACVTPAVLKVLADKFNIMPITTPEQDLKAILG